MDSRAEYIELCNAEPSIPLFCQAWWLDAVYGEGEWDVILARNDHWITGALPYKITKGVMGMREIVMPRLTPHVGAWIRHHPNQKFARRISNEKEVLCDIIRQLDALNIAHFSQHFHHSFTNWLPFFWDGFQETTRYTYVIEDLSDLDAVYEGFDKSKRREIRKAGESMTVREDLPARDFHAYYSGVLAGQGETITYPLALLEGIFARSYERGQGKVFFCEDRQGTLCGATLIIWDEMSAYWLVNALDPAHRGSGVGSLLAWEGIKHVAGKTRQFDFEGSVVESYERAYRDFGGVQHRYFNIRKTYSPLLLMRDGVRTFKRGVVREIKRVLGRKA